MRNVLILLSAMGVALANPVSASAETLKATPETCTKWLAPSGPAIRAKLEEGIIAGKSSSWEAAATRYLGHDKLVESGCAEQLKAAGIMQIAGVTANTPLPSAPAATSSLDATLAPARPATPAPQPSATPTAASSDVAAAANPVRVETRTVIRNVPARVDLSGIRSDIADLQGLRRELRAKPKSQLSTEQFALLDQLGQIDDLIAKLKALPASGVVQTTTLSAEQQSAIAKVVDLTDQAEAIEGLQWQLYGVYVALLLLAGLIASLWLRKPKFDVSGLATKEDLAKSEDEIHGRFDRVVDDVQLDSASAAAINKARVGKEVEASAKVNSVPTYEGFWFTKLNNGNFATAVPVGDTPAGQDIGNPHLFIRRAHKHRRDQLKDFRIA